MLPVQGQGDNDAAWTGPQRGAKLPQGEAVERVALQRHPPEARLYKEGDGQPVTSRRMRNAIEELAEAPTHVPHLGRHHGCKTHCIERVVNVLSSLVATSCQLLPICPASRGIDGPDTIVRSHRQLPSGPKTLNGALQLRSVASHGAD